jgi:hypothetical protein
VPSFHLRPSIGELLPALATARYRSLQAPRVATLLVSHESRVDKRACNDDMKITTSAIRKSPADGTASPRFAA